MTNNAIKQAVVDKLADDLKIYLDRNLSFDDLLPYVERASGRRIQRKQAKSHFFQMYLEARKIIEPTTRPFKPWTPKPHPRRVEIEAGQPPMISGVRAVGNGGESIYWKR